MYEMKSESDTQSAGWNGRQCTTTRQRMTETTDPLGLPWNLADWVIKEQLLEWIAEAVGALDWENPEVVDFQRQHPEFRPKTLLMLLTYAYATGLYAVDDIADECLTDETCWTITGGEPPAVEEMVPFRRQTRWLVSRLLLELFKRVLKAEYRLDDSRLPRWLELQLAEAAKLRTDIAQEMDSRPANQDGNSAQMPFPPAWPARNNA